MAGAPSSAARSRFVQQQCRPRPLLRGQRRGAVDNRRDVGVGRSSKCRHALGKCGGQGSCGNRGPLSVPWLPLPGTLSTPPRPAGRSRREGDQDGAQRPNGHPWHTLLRDLGKPLALVVVAPAIPLGMEPEPFDRRPVLDELARAFQGLPPLGEWIESAACADLGGGADVFTEDHPDVEELALAEAVCWRCAVLAECRGTPPRRPSTACGARSGTGRRRSADRPRRALSEP